MEILSGIDGSARFAAHGGGPIVDEYSDGYPPAVKARLPRPRLRYRRRPRRQRRPPRPPRSHLRPRRHHRNPPPAQQGRSPLPPSTFVLA